MKTANISYAKNHLSELIATARGGDAVIIVDRDKPVARLEPINSRNSPMPERLLGLVRSGVISPAKRALKPGEIGKMDLPRPAGGDIVRALLADREDGR